MHGAKYVITTLPTIFCSLAVLCQRHILLFFIVSKCNKGEHEPFLFSRVGNNLRSTFVPFFLTKPVQSHRQVKKENAHLINVSFYLILDTHEIENIT